MNRASETRSRRVIFSAPLKEKESANLRSALQGIEGLLKLETGADHLDLEYEFPACCFDDIWQRLVTQIASGRMSLLNRIGYMLRAFAEHNERDHSLFPRHWYIYTEAIYVHYFDYRHGNSNEAHKNLWRRYRKDT